MRLGYPSSPPPVSLKGGHSPRPARSRCVPLQRHNRLNTFIMAGFFAQLRANSSNAPLTAQPSLRIYGDSYEPVNSRILASTEVAGRKIFAARVNQREQVNRQGMPYIAKEVEVFLAGTDGKPSTAQTYLRLRQDNPMQVGQWLDPASIRIANMKQGGRLLNGVYLEDATVIEKDAVDPEFKAFCETKGIAL